MLTIGKLDGVHAGHRHLAARVMTEADRRGVLAAAVVLHPDPRTVLHGAAVPVITSVEERVRRLRGLGLDLVEPMQFTADVAAMDREAFVELLSRRYRLVAVVAGPDWRFGRGRGGDIRCLQRLGRRRGFDVAVVEPLEAEGSWISSRRLREAIEAGRVEQARALLCRPYRLVGTVVHGAARGRRLGYPTANLDPVETAVLPANGIYAVRAAWVDPATGQPCTAGGTASVGVRPTFDHGERLIEVHLLDVDEDLYGRDLAVDFLVRQRDERRFANPAELVAQIARDVRRTRHELGVELAVDAGAVRRGGHWKAVSRDLARLAEALGVGLLDIGPAPPGDLLRQCLSVESAGGEAELLRAWLQALLDLRASGRSVAAVHVYSATRQSVHGLLGLSDGAPKPVSPVVRVDRLARVGARYEARLSLAER